MKKFRITREIGIDAAHRVPTHGSKCQHLHGHRYTIQATCEGELFESGEQQGMVLDFGFLKEAMMEHIDGPCDHATILYSRDLLVNMLKPACGKVVLVDFIPTAENLAKFWFTSLQLPVRARSNGQAELVNIRVYETPNCWADYPNGV